VLTGGTLDLCNSAKNISYQQWLDDVEGHQTRSSANSCHIVLIQCDTKHLLPSNDSFEFGCLSAFRPRGVPGPTSKIVTACPSPDGLARDGT
jgi:hypothetical protein